MTSLRTALVALVAILTLPPAATGSAPADDLRFTVYLGDREIGEHRFDFESTQDGYRVNSHARMSVDFLFFTAYRYEHHSHERWDARCVERIDARTDDDGKQYRVEGTRREGAFVLRTGDDRRTLRACVRTFAYWDPALLRVDRLLNAQTGEYLDVEVQILGQETLQVNDREVMAQRRRLTGPDLQIDLWHSLQGRWLALESKTAGGTLRYRLQPEEQRR